ncbi:MAG: TetR family transcriptional regulator [Alphaproteobacteria bacterium]|nr:TetR family transcriptional regulator [Alphaproteobacteria bacterium]
MPDTIDLDRDHGRAPQQSRSRESLTRIVEAAEILFAERGYDGTTVNDIVSRARCSVGSFYARFKDKEGLFLHIHDQQCALLIQRIDFLGDLARAENASLENVVRQSVRALFLFAGQRRELTRVFIQRSGVDAEFHARYARTWGEVRDRLRPVMLARKNEIKADTDATRAVDFTLQLMHSLWANDVLHHKMKDITGQETGENLIEDLTDSCLAWLGLRPAAIKTRRT